MLRNIIKTGTSSAFLLFPSRLFDTNEKTTETESQIDLTAVRNETGLDRLTRMFEIDEFGNVSKELLSILHVGGMSTLVGAIYGGVIHSRVAYMDFIRNNQATAFRDHLDAKRKLQDKVSISFGKGAWKWSWRLTFFCTTFVSVTTLISVYRGKSSIMEYAVAGFITGASYKFNMGPRGWLVGGCLGTVLGLIGGGMTVGLMSLTGMSIDEARYWQYYWQNERKQYMNKGISKVLEEEEMEVMKLHRKKVKDISKDEEVLAEIAATTAPNK